jgi:hypothetical protein
MVIFCILSDYGLLAAHLAGTCLVECSHDSARFYDFGGLMTQVFDFFELRPGRIRNLRGNKRL